MKIVTILGARPQFIKASVVSASIKRRSGLHEVVVHTGQHFDFNMSDIFFDELGMDKPDYHLGVNGGSHGAMTGRMIESIERVLIDQKPDAVLVYGDTNSTLAGGLAAAKLHIPIAHVEAGLRSFNMRMPEEINRILTDRISTWLFAPTSDSVLHLKNEGMPSHAIYQVGDVMYDCVLHHGKRADTWKSDIISSLGLKKKGYVLVTIHRAENTDDLDRFKIIVDSLLDVADERPVVWPVHPRARALLERTDAFDRLARKVKLIQPLGYMNMLQLERGAALIVTDSGGMQKEAFFQRVPCVTLRDETEWTELVDAGWNHLVPPTNKNDVVSAILHASESSGKEIKPYGDGHASERIVDELAALAL